MKIPAPASNVMTIVDAATAVDSRQFRAAMSRFATGVAIVTTSDGQKREALTINSFSSLSLDPPLVLWSLRKNAPSLETFSRARYFAVNVLSAANHGLSQHFATARPNKLEGIDYVSGLGDCPLLIENLASFECRRAQIIEGGDHMMFIGEVLRATHRDDVPLIFSAGRYCVPAPL